MSNIKSLLKDTINDKVDIHSKEIERCLQSDDLILFEFGHITNHKKHSSLALENEHDNKAYKSLFKLIEELSKITWPEMSARDKHQIGGLDSMPFEKFERDIAENIREEYTISNDTNMYVYYFGQGNKYRLICHRSDICKRILHVIGFETNFDLYKH